MNSLTLIEIYKWILTLDSTIPTLVLTAKKSKKQQLYSSSQRLLWRHLPILRTGFVPPVANCDAKTSLFPHKRHKINALFPYENLAGVMIPFNLLNFDIQGNFSGLHLWLVPPPTAANRFSVFRLCLVETPQLEIPKSSRALSWTAFCSSHVPPRCFTIEPISWSTPRLKKGT